MKLMCVVAHPDDECFAFGGALALAADRGISTSVICLTDGQAAKNRGDAQSGEELGRIRREEFAASCRVLGVHQHEMLDYQDAQLEFTDFPRTAGRLVERIRRFQPEVVLTFGNDGGLNSHPDHMMVSMLTSAAFHWSGQAKRYPDQGPPFSPHRLYHLTTDHFLPDRVPPRPLPWTVSLDISTVRERKQQAFRQHASQAPLIEQTREAFERYGANEFYTLVAALTPQQAVQQTDLFPELASQTQIAS